MSFGVNFYGRSSEPGNVRKTSGFLLLFPDGLFYRSRFARLELELPADKIARVYHGRSHKGVELHQSVMKIEFVNEKGQIDTVAFRVPYPPQWIRAIETTLLEGLQRGEPAE